MLQCHKEKRKKGKKKKEKLTVPVTKALFQGGQEVQGIGGSASGVWRVVVCWREVYIA